MIKDNFICPCCGLPKHLEFKTEEDYWRYVNAQDNSEVGDNSYKFTNFILSGEEEDRLREIQQRFNTIKGKTNWNQSFSQWFKENVVGFVNESESYFRWELLIPFQIEEQITVPSYLFSAEVHTQITGNIEEKVDNYLKITSTINDNTIQMNYKINNEEVKNVSIIIQPGNGEI